MNLNAINIEEFKEIVQYIISNNKVLFESGKKTTAIEIIGEAGLGKTSAVLQFAEEHNMTCVKLNLSQIEELGDLIGFPIKEYKVCKCIPTADLEDQVEEECLWVSEDVLSHYINSGYEINNNESRMGYAIPSWVPTEEDPNGIILILDDFSRADPRFIQATMELIDRGEYISWKLPPNCTIVLTSNPDNGDYNVTSLDNAQKTRYVSFQVDFDIEVWARWAESEEIDSRFINFILRYPEIMGKEGSIQKVNPRSLVTFANTISGIKDWEKRESLAFIHSIAKGCFTSNDNIIGNLFTQFIANKLDKLTSPEDMLKKPWKTIEPALISQVGEGDKYRTEIASILATRFLNYSMYHFSKKGSKTDLVTKTLLNILESEKVIFSEDLVFMIVRTLYNNHKSRMNGILHNKKVIKAIS